MKKHAEPDMMFVKMPSLRAVKAFVAAAKYRNFTRAAESLCVSQAAVSKQVRELESYLGSDLFQRAGSTMQLTEAGQMLFDAAYLSFVNIAQAAQRIRTSHLPHRELYICASPAFSSLWLAPRIATFFSEHPEIGISILTTDDFLSFKPSDKPDVILSMNTANKEGYASVRLFLDRIYPVCSPAYLDRHPGISTIEGLKEATLLDLSSFRMAQIYEHIDWSFWFDRAGAPLLPKHTLLGQTFHANDYNVLLQMALNDQGVALGWHHLVESLVDAGRLVRPIEQEVVLKEKAHYLFYDKTIADDRDFLIFKDWLLSYF